MSGCYSFALLYASKLAQWTVLGGKHGCCVDGDLSTHSRGMGVIASKNSDGCKWLFFGRKLIIGAQVRLQPLSSKRGFHTT